MVNLYHGSPERGILILKPQMRSKRHDQTTPRIYASSNPGIASLFILDWDDRYARLGKHNDGPWTFRILDSNKVYERPGSLYQLNSEGFTHVKGGVEEYFAVEPVRILRESSIESPLSFAQEHGIRIEFS